MLISKTRKLTYIEVMSWQRTVSSSEIIIHKSWLSDTCDPGLLTLAFGIWQSISEISVAISASCSGNSLEDTGAEPK